MRSLPPPPDLPTDPCQLTLVLDGRKLRGLQKEQRDAVLGALVGLLLEAADIAEREEDDARI